MIALEIEDFRRFSMGQKESFEIEQIRKSWKEKKSDSWINNHVKFDDDNIKETKEGTSKSTCTSRMDFDELLPHVGEYGIYQVFLFLLMLPFLFFLAFVYMSQMFMTLTPNDHWCIIPGLRNNTLTNEQL